MSDPPSPAHRGRTPDKPAIRGGVWALGLGLLALGGLSVWAVEATLGSEPEARETRTQPSGARAAAEPAGSAAPNHDPAAQGPVADHARGGAPRTGHQQGPHQQGSQERTPHRRAETTAPGLHGPPPE